LHKELILIFHKELKNKKKKKKGGGKEVGDECN
jgi:hypothetical protein